VLFSLSWSEHSKKNIMRLVALLLICLFGPALSPLRAAETSDLFSTRHTNAVPAPLPLVQGPNDDTIVQFVARLLQHQHYLQMPINKDVASKFLDRYLDSLDNLHIYFIQSDLDEFEKYRYRLDDLTVNQGDTTVSRLVFTRFRQRLNQQYEYVLELLKENKFDFTGNDRYTVDRKKLSRPRDLAEAKKLWRDRLRYEYLIEKLSKVESSDIVTNLTRRYTRVLRLINEYDNDDALQIYLTALARVYDPHSDYMGKSEFDNFSIGMKLSLYGIGALLESDDGICKIRSLTDGGPAQRSKQFKPGDKIIAVAQSNQPPVDVMDIKLSKVVEQIRGPKGTEVRLTIIPADAPNSTVRKVVTLVRDEIKLEDSAAKAKIIELPVGKDSSGQERLSRLGVIDLPSFYSGAGVDGRRPGAEQKSTTTDVAKLLRKLMQEKVSGVILDLRHNGGGLLDEAISLTGLFIKEGPVVQVRNYDGTTSEDKDPDSSVLYDGPMVVLTSRYSASASEILAGALQDYGRALIVGDSSTHGKGTVQSLLDLKPIMRRSGVFMTNDPGALKVTIRKFYRASGASTQLKGVVPDIVLPSVNNHIEVGEASLDNPLEWDTIQSADYEKMNRVQPYLSELKRRSDQRIASDRDFAWVATEIERFKKLQAEKSVSLNEAVRLKEKKENDERAKTRKKELASRPEPSEKVYDITLKVAEQPGLPPPTVRTNQTASVPATNGASIAIKGSTNKVSADPSVAKAGKPKPKSDDEEDDLDTPPVDITLNEAERILIDYASLLNNGKGVALTRPGQSLSNPVQPKGGAVTR
jgi:carboxyl-terminal processing protease